MHENNDRVTFWGIIKWLGWIPGFLEFSNSANETHFQPTQDWLDWDFIPGKIKKGTFKSFQIRPFPRKLFHQNDRKYLLVKLALAHEFMHSNFGNFTVNEGLFEIRDPEGLKSKKCPILGIYFAWLHLTPLNFTL